MATEGTIINCFNRLRAAFNRPFSEDDVAIVLHEWTDLLSPYDEIAVLDATDTLVMGEEFPKPVELLAAVQRAARSIAEERAFAWGDKAPVEEPVDVVGVKRLIGVIRDGLKTNKGIEHNHREGIAGCPICSRHDHTHGLLYCEVCNPGTPFVAANGKTEDEMNECRYGCDPRSHLIEIYVDSENAEMPPGVMSAHTAVRPCPLHAPEQHEALLNGKWGSMAGTSKRRKGGNTSVNDDE